MADLVTPDLARHVTQSVRAGIAVDLRVLDRDGRVLTPATAHAVAA